MTIESAQHPHAGITLPPEDAYIAAVLDFVETLAGGLGFDKREQRHIRLAMEEMLQFIRQTALVDQETPLSLSFEPQADGLVIRIVEKGLPLDLNRMPSFTPSNLLNDDQSEGLSLYLAKQFMDDIVFKNRGRDGVEVEMLKRRASSHIQNRLPASAPSAEAIPALGSDFSIRPAQESDALEISRCAFLTYGYTYEDYIYYPERIVELFRSGELRSLVAVSSEGTVIGHCGMKFSPPQFDRAELGLLFVRPECRKIGVGAALTKASIDRGRELELDSLYVRSVTGHRASQTLAEHNGFRDCALFLALFPRSVNLQNLGGVQEGKMSGVFQWLKLRPPRHRTIRVPARYLDTVKELYQRAEIPVTFVESNGPSSPAGEPFYEIQHVPILNVGNLLIESIGASPEEAARWVEINCRRLCREKIEAVYLHINIEQPGAEFVVEQCTRKGFLFSGIIPGAFPGGDALVLQYLNLPEDPFARMTVWTETAALLRDRIHDDWQTHETLTRND